LSNGGSPRLGHFFYRNGIEEGHGGAELLAYYLDGMFGFGFAEG
jgi:hypothetical protein